VPTYHNCGKVGHIRPNCFLLKIYRSWIKQDAPRKGKVEEPSSSKYVPPYWRHIKGKDNVICKNANLKSVETVKSIQTKVACPPIITVASLVTSDPNVHNEKLK
jgi:hypothetical protein